MTTCTRCGTLLPPGAMTCTGCGLPLGAAPDAPSTPVTASPIMAAEVPRGTRAPDNPWRPQAEPDPPAPYEPAPIPVPPAPGTPLPIPLPTPLPTPLPMPPSAAAPPDPAQTWAPPPLPPTWGAPPADAWAAPPAGIPGGYPPGGYAGQPGWPGQPAPPRTSGQAIASLVLAILWIFGAGSLAAVILAHMDRSRSQKFGEQPSGVGLAGLIIGYIGLAGIVSLIALIAFGAFAVHNAIDTIQQNSQSAGVRSNMRNLATAEETFLTENARYTDAAADLDNVGFRIVPGTEGEFLEVGVTGTTGYCIVGATSVTSSTWYLYDSQNFGMQATLYSGPTEAQSACAIGGITSYAPVS